MNKEKSTKSERQKKVGTETVVSQVLGTQGHLETLYAPRLERTIFAHWDQQKYSLTSSYMLSDTKQLVPVKPSNNLIKHNVLLLPSDAQEYGTDNDLVQSIRDFIHQYVDLGEHFETISTYYVMLSWVYDRFREIPYLRMQGDYGTGKSRFLQVIGSLCYKPLFASGASTVSPIFHTLNTFRGTLVMDEADFRFSDEKSDIVKILNNGNMKGFPLLRSEVSNTGTYNPKAFYVYGPKVLATRGSYSDPALESRIITKRAQASRIRSDIPLTLPESFETEAEQIRNKLLMYRFKNWHKLSSKPFEKPNDTSNRTAQIFQPLLVIAKDSKARSIIYDYAHASDAILKSYRAHSVEEQVLNVLHELLINADTTMSVAAITKLYQSKHGAEHTKPVTNKWIGGIVRSKLHLATAKRNGIYVIPESEIPRLKALFIRYGIEPSQ